MDPTVSDHTRLAWRTPWGRLASGEVAGAALYLASDPSSHVAGSTVTVDEGRSAYGFV